MKRNLNNCNLVVGDNTGAMVISLLEENIDKVSVDNSYCFHLVTAKSLYRKQLNSSRASTISTCDNVVISDKLSVIARGLVANDVSSESIVGRILAVSIKEVVHLHKCTSKILDIPGQSVFKCLMCALAIILADIIGNNIGRFYCPNAVMQSFFAKLSDMQLFSIEEADLAELSVEMMEEIMLNLKNVKIEIVTGFVFLFCFVHSSLPLTCIY